MTTSKLYPNNPEYLPKDLTKLTTIYKVKVTLAILAVLLFFVSYTAMVVSAGYLIEYAIFYPIYDVNKFTILLKIGAIAIALTLFTFTLKFLFKIKNHKIPNRVKLKEKDNPELWAFVMQICQDTGAPTPKSIYVDPDVNAYVSYSNVWLSLIFPVKKELTIGLGLVSCLNISEFKAVVSHEFGHFAQRSMRIGSFIMSANTIIHDMIFSRDSWDNALDQWRSADIRVSIFAWAVTPIIWVIRQLLNLFYQFLNIMHSSLSREMEFNADKVAVSTSGSDAIVSGLWRLDNGSTNWNNTIQNAYLSSQKNAFVNNLYTHHLLAVDRDSAAQNELIANFPNDVRGGKEYFNTSELSKVSMYASHPPNDIRQASAKSPYVKCETDTRSPWLLFGTKEALQKEVTTLIYDQYLNKKPDNFIEVNAFESFIAAENIGKDLLDEYDNNFENRFLKIEDVADLQKQANNTEQIMAKTELVGEIKTLMKPVREIETLLQQAVQISEGTSKQKSFTYDNKTFQKKQLEEGYNYLMEKRETLFNTTFKEWDTKFCVAHIKLANNVNKTIELKALYRQHQTITQVYKAIVDVKNEVMKGLVKIQNNTALTQLELDDFGNKANKLFCSLNKNLDLFDGIEFVALPNIDNTKELKEAIIPNGVFTQQEGRIFENGGFDKLMTQIENAVAHSQRIDQKSISNILSFHSSLRKSAA